MSDQLSKFLFEGATARGELVELQTSWQSILEHHDYPEPVQRILGELSAAAVLLCANLKFEGSMILQIHGDGMIKLLVVECNNRLEIRAMAKLNESTDHHRELSLIELINENGKGRFIITLDPSDKSSGQQAYQGIVPLVGESIAEIIENYMRKSEQLETRLYLASNEKLARGMLLQKLPYFGGKAVSHEDEKEQELAQQTWERAIILGNTLKREELLVTDIETLLHRLFWEETLQVFEPQSIRFVCSCSREKVGNMLVMLGKAEVEDAINSLGKLEINCDFCGKPYVFDAVDCAGLFVNPPVMTDHSKRTH